MRCVRKRRLSGPDFHPYPYAARYEPPQRHQQTVAPIHRNDAFAGKHAPDNVACHFVGVQLQRIFAFGQQCRPHKAGTYVVDAYVLYAPDGAQLGKAFQIMVAETL